MSDSTKNQVEVVLGLQYGDEGKGKFVDLLAANYDYIVRYQGGDNAGHSIVIDQKRYALRIIPSGIFNHKKVVIGNGCVVNPETLLTEISYLSQAHFDVQDRLFLSDKAHIIFDYHIALDKLNEANKGADKIGTTCKGIGPCYTDKAARIGIRVCELFDRPSLTAKLTYNLNEKNQVFAHAECPLFDVSEVVEKYYAIGQQLKQYVTNTAVLLNQAYNQHAKILLEGAQGVLLDIDHGTYPYVTSSNVATGMSVGTGLGITKFTSVLGIVKAYTSRVGSGPFCSEILSELAEQIRIKGHEFGTVTKRPRRIGWIDIVALKEAIQIAGVTKIAITLVDVLSGLKEVQLCTHYQFHDRVIDYVPSTIREYGECQPIYKTMTGWTEEITTAKKYSELPKNCQLYLQEISRLLGVPIVYVSVGPDRSQTFEVSHD